MYKFVRSISLKFPQHEDGGRRLLACFHDMRFPEPLQDCESPYALLVTQFKQYQGFREYHSSILHRRRISQFDRAYEPDYLDCLRPKIPVYESISLQIRGYDFAILERFQSLVHSLSNSMGLHSSNAYALPPESWKVDRYVSKSTKVEAELALKKYKRVILFKDVSSSKLAIFLEMLQECTPPGVTCSIAQHTEAMEKDRYVPDLQLKSLRQELEELGGPRNQPVKK